MIEIVICDDEETDLKEVSKMVSEICLNEVIDYNLKTYSSGEEMLERTYSIDIGILDISMCKLNGIDLGRELKKRFPEVKLIYITSYEQYCQQVINKVHAFSFLTKPIKYEDVRDQIVELLDDMEDDASGRKREFYNVTTSDEQEIEMLKLDLKDILLTDKAAISKEKKIKFDIKVDNINMDFLEAIDTTTIFGNLIDNALEAVEKVEEDRWIRISILPHQEMVFVRIENTSLPLRWRNGFPVSEKGKNHGIGLLNVKRSIEKYDGDISFQQKNGIVTVDLLLNS